MSYMCVYIKYKNACTTFYFNVFQIFMMIQTFCHITCNNFGENTDNMIGTSRHGYKGSLHSIDLSLPYLRQTM